MMSKWQAPGDSPAKEATRVARARAAGVGCTDGRAQMEDGAQGQLAEVAVSEYDQKAKE